MKYLVDSDVLIEVLRNNKPVADELEALHNAKHTLCYSPITKAEIYHGLRQEEEERTARLFAGMECFIVDDSIAEQAGEHLRTYHRSHGLQLPDALIAATAFYRQAVLITFNRRHYPMDDIKFHDLLPVT